MKVRVPVFGTVGKSVTFDPAATAGAMIGRDLRLPDGSIPTLAQLAAALGVSTDSGDNQFAYTVWNMIQDIPPNVQQVAGLSTVGLVTRRSDGSWVTRLLAVADDERLTITNPTGDGGNPVLDLAEVAYVESGLLRAIALDDFGRVVGYRDAMLNDLEDVALSAPATHDALMYDETAEAWGNVPTGPRYLAQTTDEHFYDADDFVRGHNIVGVRYAGEADVYLPHDLPTEHIVVVKDEAGLGQVRVRIY